MYTISQLMERRIWWDKFTKIKDGIVQGDACYCKEKRGRYDTSYWGERPGVQDRLLYEVELESEKCCQYCGKHRPQIWLETGWVIHICWLCYIRRMLFIFRKKIKRWWIKLSSGALLHSA